jgi:hypothetical protein
VKLGDGHRAKGDFRPAPACCLPDHCVVDEIKEESIPAASGTSEVIRYCVVKGFGAHAW